MNTNEEYWSDFYANSNELPLESSNFAVYILKFLQNSLEKKSYKNILSIGCGNGMTCTDIFEPVGFRDNGSSHLRSSDEASEIYGRADRSNIARGG